MQTCKVILHLLDAMIACGLVLHIIGLALPSWSLIDGDEPMMRGLWQQCAPDCQYYDSAAVTPIRALVPIALFDGLVALILIIRKTFQLNRVTDGDYSGIGRRSLYVVVAAAVLSTILNNIGFILWKKTANNDLQYWHLGPGEILSLCGSLIMWVAALMWVLCALKILRTVRKILVPSPATIELLSAPVSTSLASQQPARRPVPYSPSPPAFRGPSQHATVQSTSDSDASSQSSFERKLFE